LDEVPTGVYGELKDMLSMEEDSEGMTRLVVLELAVVLVAILLKSDMATIDGDETLELVEEDVDDSESVGLLLWSEGGSQPAFE
jgi:hypothetical protein